MKLTLDHIGKQFPRRNGAELEVLRELSLTVGDEEFCCLVGPSGCGKSTILNIAAGLTSPDKGRVLADGAALDRRRLRIGYVFQKPRLLNWRSTLDNVIFALRAAGVRESGARETAQGYLDLVGLGKFAEEFPLALSGGMQQRVAIARALAIEPDLLLMDEPFSHLDEITARTLRAELLRICEGWRRPVLFVTHNALEAAYLGDRVVVLSARPTTILRDFPVAIPKHREMEDPRLIQLQRAILGALGVIDGSEAGS